MTFTWFKFSGGISHKTKTTYLEMVCLTSVACTQNCLSNQSMFIHFFFFLLKCGLHYTPADGMNKCWCFHLVGGKKQDLNWNIFFYLFILH